MGIVGYAVLRRPAGIDSPGTRGSRRYDRRGGKTDHESTKGRKHEIGMKRKTGTDHIGSPTTGRDRASVRPSFFAVSSVRALVIRPPGLPGGAEAAVSDPIPSAGARSRSAGWAGRARS